MRITVLYSCHGCGLRDRGVVVMAREPGESLEAWMSLCRAQVASDHWTSMPHCHSRVCDLKIPYAGRGVGEPPVH